MKKVLFVINTLGGAGAERALIQILKRFDPKEYEVSLYVLLDQGEMIHEIPEFVKVLNRKYSDISVLSEEGKKELARNVWRRIWKKGSGLRNAGYLIQQASGMIHRRKLSTDKLLWKVMSDSGQTMDTEYDLAIAYLEGGSTYFVHDHVKARRKVAFVHVDYKLAGYSRSLDRNCYLDYDHIFTVSNEVRDSFVQVYPECADRTDIFYNQIDQAEIRQKAELSGGFSDDFDGFRILTVGRLTSQKAYEIAIDAMAKVKAHGIKARWYVLGEGELREELQQRIDKLGLTEDFLLCGAVKNPYPYYKQCDLYVHATRFEGKSIAIQEAQTLGCAILVSDCSGNREQVRNGIDGELCDLNPESVSEHVIRLLGDEKLRDRYRKNAAEIIFQEEDILKLFQ